MARFARDYALFALSFTSSGCWLMSQRPSASMTIGMLSLDAAVMISDTAASTAGSRPIPGPMVRAWRRGSCAVTFSTCQQTTVVQ